MDVLAWPCCPVSSSPFNVTLDIRLADRVDGFISEEADKIAPNDRRPISRMVLATVIALAFRDDELDELFGDLLKRTNGYGEAVLYPIVRLTPYLVGPMMRLIVVVCFETFSNLDRKSVV